MNNSKHVRNASFRATVIGFVLSIFGAACGTIYSQSIASVGSSPTTAVTRAVAYLSGRMDRYHQQFWVYSDGDAAGNHFVHLARMSNLDDAKLTAQANRMLPPMDLFCTNQPHSGLNCIEASFRPRNEDDWGGWYFMNGVLTNKTPEPNWGTQPDAGWNLSGARQLSFWVRGKEGGEYVEFFACGVGRDPERGITLKECPFPDSFPKRTTGVLKLTKQWRPYTISLKSADLNYVLGGFGWAANARNNHGSITFYLDDIAFDLPRLKEPRFLISYECQPTSNEVDRVLRNTAYTYDNALALMAFLAVGDRDRAGLIADAFVAAQEHDREFQDGSLRNAYQGGDLFTPPGWSANGKLRTVRLPGFTNVASNEWDEDPYCVSRDTGNMAWAMLGLLAYHEAVTPPGQRDRYLAAAEKLGGWVINNCPDVTHTGGFTSGQFQRKLVIQPQSFKATEHNIDLYAAFQRLYLATGDDAWKRPADQAKRFVASMWDDTEGKFWTGTTTNGITINKDVIPLDIQAWALLALKDQGLPYLRSLDYAEREITRDDGYDFSKKPATNLNCSVDGVWFEGTAHMATAYRLMDQYMGGSNATRQARADELLKVLERNQSGDGGMPACSVTLWTGFHRLGGDDLWWYYSRKHIGATAWLVFAETGYNPYWPRKVDKH